MTCPGADEPQPNGHGSGLSITELVKKNADLRDKLRVERSKNAQLDLDMEQVRPLLAMTARTGPHVIPDGKTRCFQQRCSGRHAGSTL